MSERLFVAVVPDDAVRAALEQLERPSEPGVRWVPASNWHITLRFWADADPAAIIDALDAAVGASADSAGLRTAHAVIGPVVSRFGHGALVLPVRGLEDLAAAVIRATTAIAPAGDPRAFAGHLTLGRIRRRAACGLAGHPFRAEMDVTSIVLVRSELRPDGARHTPITEWQLSR